MPRAATVLLVVLAALNLADILIHVRIDQVEPLRITSNAVVIMAVLVAYFARTSRRAFVVPLVAALIYLTLNLIFIALESIGTLGALLVTVTTLLLVALVVVLAKVRHTRAA